MVTKRQMLYRAWFQIIGWNRIFKPGWSKNNQYTISLVFKITEALSRWIVLKWQFSKGKRMDVTMHHLTALIKNLLYFWN